MLGRSRLQEFYQRVLREDMLTLFHHTADLRALECSIVLHGSSTMNDETKYRAACILEILTGQRVVARECDVMLEDPEQKTASEAQRREMEKARGAFIQQSMLAGRKKGAPKLDKFAMGEQIRKLGSGLKLKTDLHNIKMYYFLEKCREFYLPDVVMNSQNSASGSEQRHGWRPLGVGHDNELSKRGLVLNFEKRGGSRRSCYPERYPVRRNENPREAISCYLLKSTDLLKFPDIELHFEALGPVLGGRNASSHDSNALQLILRPSIQVTSPLDKQTLWKLPKVETLRVMNYLLSQYFNSYLNRPHIGS